jgi:hypothetical protein
MFPKCNQMITFDFIITNMDDSVFQKEYKDHRTNLIMTSEMAQMENTQATIRAYLNAQICLSKNKQKYAAEQCIAQFGCGWEEYDFGAGMGRQPSSDGKSSMHCPAKNCPGFIYSYVCNICSCRICISCHEIRKTTDHKCDPNIVASVKAMASETKACPKCSVAIFKREGCDQMFCTQCHVTFSWLTLKIHTGDTHNPHFFEWLFQKKNKGNTVPQTLQVERKARCEQFITWKDLKSCFNDETLDRAKQIRKHLPSVPDIKKPLESVAHYYVAFENLRQKIVHVRATSGNHAYVQPIDNRDLRVQFSLNEIDEAKFRSLLISRDFEYRKMMCYCNVYFTVYQLSLVLFDNLYTFLRERFKIQVPGLRKKKCHLFFFDIYSQLLTVLETGNECLDHYNRVFGRDSRLQSFSIHPYTDLPKNEQKEV